MPYVTSVERLAKQEGQLQGLRESVIDALEARFGDVPYQMREAINHVDRGATLKKLLKKWCRSHRTTLCAIAKMRSMEPMPC